jgi:hypothetical protein
MHDLDNLTPTVVMGNFNTHSPQWSLAGQPASSWGQDLTEWFDLQGLTCLNPLNPHDTPTWYDPSIRDASPSVINLTLVNEAAIFSGQTGDLYVSDGPFPLTDHAALTLMFYPITSLHLILPPTPAGYNADPKLKDDWQKTFRQLESTCPTPTVESDLNTLIANLDNLIQTTCKATLKPRHNPHPTGAQWWTEECTHLHTTARSAPPGPERKATSKALKLGVSHTKRVWAYDKLHQAVDAQDIWSLAKV